DRIFDPFVQGMQSLDLAEVGRRIADSVCRLLEAPASALYRLEADTNQCVLVAVSGGAGPTWTTVIPAGMGMVGVAVAERSTIAAPDVLADPRVRYPDAMRARVADNPFRPVLAVPLLVTQRVIGALAVGDRRGRTFDAHELELAQAFANHAAVALENARLYRDARARRVEAEMARAEAEAASRAKDQFLAVLSHELRNPLAPIQTATAIIRRTAGANPRVERAREVIERQLRHIARLVDDLLDVAGITQGKLALRRAPVPLRAVVAEAVETARRLFETHRQRLTVRVTSADPVVDGDRDRLRQIVTNLLLNAGKYTPPGGDIVLTLGVEGTEATIVVADNGDGIPPELIDRIFDPFVQGMQSLDRPHGGLGLGLTLVKRLVDLHGGTVTAASDGPGQGSRFEVRLPLASADPEPEPAGAPPRTRPRRFLVIEDNDDAREMLALALRLEGHEVETASDGGDGVRQAMVRRPDVVLVDIGLPGMDGFEVARRLRATLGSAVRLVALTGYGQPDDQEVGRAAGFDVHLVKPVPVDEVLAVATESGSVSGQD
ncbi:MAG TPA: ATP-binding protein, partial [Candidatus Tectomicrobia bacterium]|nr:ATP-binding protein [Candidatus Tectomicrobia bacterium]